MDPWVDYSCSAVIGGTDPQPPFTYQWVVGSEAAGTAASIQRSFLSSSTTSMLVQVVDANGVIAESEGSFFVSANTGTCPPEEPNCSEQRIRSPIKNNTLVIGPNNSQRRVLPGAIKKRTGTAKPPPRP